MSSSEAFKKEALLPFELSAHTATILNEVEAFAQMDWIEREKILPQLTDRIFLGMAPSVIAQKIAGSESILGEEVMKVLSGKKSTQSRLQGTVDRIFSSMNDLRGDQRVSYCSGIVLDHGGRVRAMATRTNSAAPDSLSYSRALLGALYSLHNIGLEKFWTGHYATMGRTIRPIHGFAKEEFMIGIGGMDTRPLGAFFSRWYEQNKF